MNTRLRSTIVSLLLGSALVLGGDGVRADEEDHHDGPDPEDCSGEKGSGERRARPGRRALPERVSHPSAQFAMAINLDMATYWSTQWPWTDAMKQASEWFSQPETQGEEFVWDSGLLARIPADGGGYPLELPYRVAGVPEPQVVHALLMRVDGKYPAGRYVCRYDGEGEIELGMDARVAASRPGRLEVDVTPSAEGVHLRIVRSRKGNHVRNIRLYLPGLEGARSPWHPRFLERLQGFRAIRFMALQGTMTLGEVPPGSWPRRARPTDYTQTTSRGVALEHLVDLANRMKADPWFCMVHHADDDHVRRFATYVRDHLHPSRRVYIEYSNEIWNSIYKVHEYARAKGLALGLSEDPYEAALRYGAYRSLEIFAIWEQVFGSTDRLVRVLASQSANPSSARTILDWKDAWKKADVLAIAPYFGGLLGAEPQVENTVKLTVAEVLDACLEDIRGNVASQIEAHHQLAARRGLALVAYEGGQHLVGVGGWDENATLNQLFDAANRHPRMQRLYEEYLDTWRRSGGGVFFHHSFICPSGKYGRWGLLETQDQDPASAWKWLAVRSRMGK